MTPSAECMHALDVVRLMRRVAGWPSGTEGTVVAEHRAYVVVEVGDPERGTTAVIDVPRGDARLVWSPSPRAV